MLWLLMQLQLLFLVLAVVAAVAMVPLPMAVLLLLVSAAMPWRTPIRQQWKWQLPSILQMPPTL